MSFQFYIQVYGSGEQTRSFQYIRSGFECSNFKAEADINDYTRFQACAIRCNPRQRRGLILISRIKWSSARFHPIPISISGCPSSGCFNSWICSVKVTITRYVDSKITYEPWPSHQFNLLRFLKYVYFSVT